MLHDVAEDDLLQARYVNQKVRTALGGRGDTFEISTVHILAQADGRDRDLQLGGLPRQRNAVAFLRNAVGQQQDVLVDRFGFPDLIEGFVERRRDLSAAVGDDPGNQLLQYIRFAVRTQRDRPLEGVVEDQHADTIDRAEVRDDADGRLPGELHLLALHRRRLVDDENHRGAFGRAGWGQARGERFPQRIVAVVRRLDVEVLLAGDEEESSSGPDKIGKPGFPRRGPCFDIKVVDDNESVRVERSVDDAR